MRRIEAASGPSAASRWTAPVPRSATATVLPLMSPVAPSAGQPRAGRGAGTCPVSRGGPVHQESRGAVVAVRDGVVAAVGGGIDGDDVGSVGEAGAAGEGQTGVVGVGGGGPAGFGGEVTG